MNISESVLNYRRETAKVAKQVMAAKDLTQRQLAEKMGLPESTISRWVRLKRSAPQADVDRMKKMLDEPPAQSPQNGTAPIISVGQHPTSVVVKIDGAYNIESANTKVEIHVNGVVIWIMRNP